MFLIVLFPLALIAAINKAISIAHKDNWKEHEQAWNDIEMILGVTNRLPKDE